MADMDKLNKFFHNHRDLCLALKNWIERQMKSFSLVDALDCVYNFANGNQNEMANIIKQITAKRRVHGRSQVYHDEKIPFVDIERDADGGLIVTGYNPDKEPEAKGMKVERNPLIFKKGDDNQVNKNFRKIEDNLYDIGKGIRDLYPNASKEDIELMIDSVRKYAAAKKLGFGRILARLKRGKLYFSDNWSIQPKDVKESRIIVIDESALESLQDEYRMTEHRFNSNVKKFLHDLLVDPINADVSFLMKANGYDRNSFIKILRNAGLLTSKQHINDKDENGQPKAATMKVKYLVPKKNFNRKIKRLYISLFEKNLPINEEEGGGAMGGATSADSSGQFSQPLFRPIRRKTYSETMEESATTQNVGNYQYDVPFAGDEETLSRHNGIGGSVSVNIAGKKGKHYQKW